MEKTLKYKYTIDTDKKIIFQVYRGIISVESLEKGFLELMADSRVVPGYNILTDIRFCDFAIDPEELEPYIQLVKKSVRGHRAKNAILTDTPLETAIATFYQELMTLHQVKIFCTYEAAMDWLGMA